MNTTTRSNAKRTKLLADLSRLYAAKSSAAQKCPDLFADLFGAPESAEFRAIKCLDGRLAKRNRLLCAAFRN